jgi:serine/threonine protein kinase
MTFRRDFQLASYQIVAQLGADGMGEVYRAKDTKLGRDVALKILPASFSNDPERVARFRREAQVLASLNHPHIAQVYGLEEANGTQFLVLELVDGESLDKRIVQGPIAVDEAFGIAKQIAEALEAAHEKGIVHRDLKAGEHRADEGWQRQSARLWVSEGCRDDGRPIARCDELADDHLAGDDDRRWCDSRDGRLHES